MKSQGPLHFIAPVFLSPSLTHNCDNRIISIPKAVLMDNGVDVSFQTGPDDIIMSYSIFILRPPAIDHCGILVLSDRSITLTPSTELACSCHKCKVLTEGMEVVTDGKRNTSACTLLQNKLGRDF